MVERIAFPCIKRGRNRHVAGFGQTPANVLDVLMDAEDFLHHQNHCERMARGIRGHRSIGGDVAVFRWYLHLARQQTRRIRSDRGGAHGEHRRCKPGAELRNQKIAPVLFDLHPKAILSVKLRTVRCRLRCATRVLP